jgi:hypothetical protein
MANTAAGIDWLMGSVWHSNGTLSGASLYIYIYIYIYIAILSSQDEYYFHKVLEKIWIILSAVYTSTCYNQPDHKRRASQQKRLSSFDGCIPYITAKLIVVPDVKKSNAARVSFHALLPFRDIFLHPCNVW